MPSVLRLNSGDRNDLDRLHPWLDDETAHLPDVTRHAMHVALEEVVLNVATHAFPTGVSGKIEVSLCTAPDAVALIVEDPGPAFDPTTVPLPERPDPLEPGGLGLALLRHYCKHISYDRSGEHNRLTLRFPLD
jgi:anti-sigma regulatory factor (Ser/Thr protein kinase)